MSNCQTFNFVCELAMSNCLSHWQHHAHCPFKVDLLIKHTENEVFTRVQRTLTESQLHVLAARSIDIPVSQPFHW